MRDTELYGQLLGLKWPWRVKHVELRLADEEVHIRVEHEEAGWTCPECGEACPLYDHSEERVWRHLDTMQYTTLLHARPPRISCGEHGVRQVLVPWAEPKGRFTILFECFAIRVLRELGVAGAQRLLRITRDEAWAIQERAVRRGLARKTKEIPELLGIDEKAWRKGQDSYLSVVCNLGEGTVEWIGDDRKAETLGEYFGRFTPDERTKVCGVAMDMWRPYALAVRTWIPDADRKMVYDRFHVMQELIEAVDRVRKAEGRQMNERGTRELKGSKYLWLRSRQNVARRHHRRFAALRRVAVKTSRAWAIKETFRRFWQLTTETGAIRFWKSWYFWATHSRLTPVVATAKKLRRHLDKLLNYFRLRISNAHAESLNGRIEKLKRIAHGYRNLENFKIAIYFHYGALDLYPLTHANS
jgi:transposase